VDRLDGGRVHDAHRELEHLATVHHDLVRERLTAGEAPTDGAGVQMRGP